jgi:hypothetical protein
MKILNSKTAMTIIIVILTVVLYYALGSDKQDTIHEVIKIGGRSVLFAVSLFAEAIVLTNSEN